MHELSIVESLIEQVEAEVKGSGHKGRVVKLELVIGRLSGVCVDSVRFAFELLTPDTLVEGTEVVVEEPKAICRCLVCESRSEIDEITAACPVCNSDNVVIEGGRELILQSIELED